MLGVAEIDRPMDVMVIEIADPLPGLPRGSHDRALALITCAATPVGTAVIDLPASDSQVAEAIEAQLGELVNGARRRHRMNGRWGANEPDVDWSTASSALVQRRLDVAANGPGVTVAVCTRDRPDDVAGVIDSLQRLRYDRLQILVVDNAPSDDATRVLVESRPGIDYVLEPTPGVSRARNRALSDSTYDYVAFIDDDMAVDPHWVTALVTELIDCPQVAATSGIVLPMELDVEAQVRFEQLGGHVGRGFNHARYDKPYLRTVQSPYYPSPGFGAGGTALFDRTRVLPIGFDVAMGPGTRTKSAEDTLIFSEILLAGHEVTFTPDAVSWHRHRKEMAALEAQMSGYGVGIGAFYAALLAHRPSRLFAMAWAAVRMILGRYQSPTMVTPAPTSETTGAPNKASNGRRQLRHLAAGPSAYIAERRSIAKKRR